MIGAAGWLVDLLEAYGWVAAFCLGCGLVGLAFWPLLVLMERLEDEYGTGDDGEVGS